MEIQQKVVTADILNYMQNEEDMKDAEAAVEAAKQKKEKNKKKKK